MPSFAMQTANPFPGMNPYLLRRWRDVHLALMADLRNELGMELPSDYSAQAEAQVEVTGKSTLQGYIPDVSITEDTWKHGHPPVWQPQTADDGAVLVDEPTIVNVESPPERWLEIRHDDGTLVTVIEVVSPTNRGRGREAFLMKRKDYLNAGVNVVEIDLLREGERLIDMDPKLYASTFGIDEHTTVMTIRPMFIDRLEIYATPLRQPLPRIRIPLRYPDPDVALNLQKQIDRIYTSGRYWKQDHNEPLDPPLSPADQAWAADLLRKAELLS
jgi:hypothetical protein